MAVGANCAKVVPSLRKGAETSIARKLASADETLLRNVVTLKCNRRPGLGGKRAQLISTTGTCIERS